MHNTPAKAEFIRDLQSANQVISPGELSQRIRLVYGWVSIYKGDPGLDSNIYRGYMAPPEGSGDRTPDNPDYYWCVLATNQEAGWSNVTWIKEMLQVIDSEKHKTSNKEQLEAILIVRRTDSPNGAETLPNVVADKNGFILALGCAVPRAHRESLRQSGVLQKLGPDKLAGVLGVPAEYIEKLLAPDFENVFEKALAEITD